VMHVEAVRIGNWVTDGLFLFGKQVWTESVKPDGCTTTLYAESDLKYWACREGAFKAGSLDHAHEVLLKYGSQASPMGPYDTLQQADQVSKILGGVK